MIKRLLSREHISAFFSFKKCLKADLIYLFQYNNITTTISTVMLLFDIIFKKCNSEKKGIELAESK